MHTKRELVELLRAHRIRLRKRLGQHYLVDPGVVRRIVESCALTDQDTVVEIGAGLGALTSALAANAGRVIALEVDRAVCHLLAQRLRGLPNVEVRCEDALNVRWADHAGCNIIGAIPYHITSPILAALAEASGAISEAWLGMQREVAQRLAATPGTKAYGRLTLLVQYRFAVQPLFRIPKTAFFPQPRVESVWVHLRAHASLPVTVVDESLLFAIIRVAFGQRRKMLTNDLTALATPRLDRRQAEAALAAAGLPARVRGEALSLQEFARLTNVIVNMKET